MMEKELREKNRVREFMTAEIQYEDEEQKERIVGKSFVRVDHLERKLDEFVATGRYSELKP